MSLLRKFTAKLIDILNYKEKRRINIHNTWTRPNKKWAQEARVEKEMNDQKDGYQIVLQWSIAFLNNLIFLLCFNP